MDAWPPDFPLPAMSRAEAPELDIDSLLDFASQSLQPTADPHAAAMKASAAPFHVRCLDQAALYKTAVLSRDLARDLCALSGCPWP